MSDPEKKPLWRIFLTTKADKQAKKMPAKVLDQLTKLIKGMEISGPVQRNWSHFSSIEKSKLVPADSYHCHIKSGRPTYVACWREADKKNKLIEVYYVGTHENAPY